ncbi:LOW QUALITY PROTEIN: Cytochrome P450 [Dillenia turbinata]|uniref:Cytochrome P450 n=1 Tax=Dillenia turbinata TaxID=194707 RepID=A0AAN8Z459_9MAGN
MISILLSPHILLAGKSPTVSTAMREEEILILQGKVSIYWLGVEPFLYIADPEFLRKMSSGVLDKSWGKPAVFREDRLPMFGIGLVMVEGEHWIHNRHVITPAFSPANLKAMTSQMVECTTKMLDRWDAFCTSHKPEIDVEHDIIRTAGEIIAKVSFGMKHGTSYENGQIVFEKLRAMQMTLFKSNRNVGVPFSEFFSPKKSLEARRIGKEIDQLLLSMINLQKESRTKSPEEDLLGVLLAGNDEDSHPGGKKLTSRELVDECKTFFFGGHETTALSLAWTLQLLVVHPEWQTQLRKEIKQVIGDGEIDSTKLAALKKMGWVWNEVLRLYSPAPNRQAREDIQVDDMVIPKGINMWIDVVGMNHDKELWGDDVFEFKPERFKDDLYGGCKHKMGFLPFGFGGRMCVGRNLSAMDYKVVLTLILSRFSLSLSKLPSFPCYYALS